MLRLLLLLLLAVACASPQRYMWVHPDDPTIADMNSDRDPASFPDLRRDTYECERDARVAAGSFGYGILIPQVNAQAFFNRCMSARGYQLVQDP